MTTQKTGATIPTNGKTSPAPVVKIDSKKEDVKTSNPIDDRLEQLDQLFALVEQREKLTDTLDDLKKFDLSSDNTRDCLSLDDGKGHKFTTYQPEVVKEAVALVRKHAQDRLNTIDSRLLAAA